MTDSTNIEDLLRDIRSTPKPEVARIAAAILEVDQVKVTTWQSDRMDVASVGPGTVALVRCHGQAETASGQMPWSTVLKIVQPDAPNQYGMTSSQFSPWREIETYRSNIFFEDHGIFRGAKCYSIDEKPDGSYWLWLEDLTTLEGSHWTKEQYLTAARAIGEFEGRWLQQDLPDAPWLNSGFRGKQLKNAGLLESLRVFLDEQRGSELVQATLPGDLFNRSTKLWDHADQVVQAEANLPPVLVHNDCHIRNLFATPADAGQPEIVAVDFAGVGIEHIGVDAGDLFGSGFTWTDPEAMLLIEIGDRFYQAWIEGLRSAGWNGDEMIARLGYLAPIYNRAMGASGLTAAVAAKPDWWEFPVRRFGGRIEDMPGSFRRRMEYLLPLCDEAIDLADNLLS